MENKNKKYYTLKKVTLSYLKDTTKIMTNYCFENEECDDCMLNHGGNCILLMCNNILENNDMGSGE